MAGVFVVEDNEGLREAVVSYLELDDHQTVAFGKLAGVEQAVSMQQPDLLILDVMLPDGDGFRFARKLRTRHAIPIIFLTARTAESDRITGFELGADDYVVKPFSMKELMLRVRAVLARSGEGPVNRRNDGSRRSWTLSGVHHLTLQEQSHRATVDDHTLDLTAAEWRVLGLLAENEGVLLSRERILGSALDYVSDASTRTVDTHIKNIRAKLDAAEWIETVRGFGYRFAGTAADDSGGDA